MKKKIGLRIKRMLIWIYYTINPCELYRRYLLAKVIKKEIGALSLSARFEKEKQHWLNLFLEMLSESKGRPLTRLNLLFTGFAVEKLILVKVAETKVESSAPTVICTQKNNYVYMKEFIPYYRSIGVKHFIIIDNESTDESLKYLEAQHDVTLYRAPYSFVGTKKAGWKLQALASNGLNKWYLWLDSDEFIVYPEMEQCDIEKYVGVMEKKGIHNVGGFMLDMYPDYNLFEESQNPENFYHDYIYFDPDSKYYRFVNDALLGGMRGRTLNLYNLKLDKTPLLYCTPNNIPNGNHTTFPKRKNLKDNYGCVLKHYKFLSSDVVKYKEMSKNNSGYWSPESQKKYLDLVGVSVKDDNSVKYIDSSSLRCFPYVKNFLRKTNS